MTEKQNKTKQKMALNTFLSLQRRREGEGALPAASLRCTRATAESET